MKGSHLANFPWPAPRTSFVQFWRSPNKLPAREDGLERMTRTTFGWPHPLILFCSLILTSACVSVAKFGYAAELPAEQLDFFEKQVRPLLVAKCYECHSVKEASGGLRLDSRSAVQTGGDSGPVLGSGDQPSRLIAAVRYQDLDLQMPPKGKLTDAEIDVLVRWVEMGAPDPRDTAPELVSGPKGMSIEDGRQFWSFQPVGNPIVPQPTDLNWVQSPIDAFILAKLDSAGLKPASPADRRTLIRRITFDLIGLPPTPEEVADFVSDESPAAYEQLIDRLLASPHYGERWGRHWLDVARYADSNGLDENLAFGNAWRYRDYVVDSFNANKPFDRFLVEQLAGDLLKDADRETLTATGFLVLGAKVLAEPDREKLTMDTIDEQIDTTGKAFLGMTLGCARCHDHKFDPIKQHDYYALGAIFKSTQTFGTSNTGAIKHWNEHSFATDVEKEQIKKIDAEIAAKNSAANSYKNAAVAKIRAEAKAKAAQYLAAAALLEPTATLGEVAEVAKPQGLHPRILHYCRLHLEYHREDPLLGKWHELRSAVQSSAAQSAAAQSTVQTNGLAVSNDIDSSANTTEFGSNAASETVESRDQQLVSTQLQSASSAIEQHYHKLFAEVDSALAALREKDPKAATLSDPTLEQARVALNDASGFLAVPPQPEFAFDETTLNEYYRLLEEARLLESSAPDETAAMGVQDAKVLVSLPVHIRGSHRNLGQPVPRDLPKAMLPSDAPATFARHESGRLELATWMASPQHPLTARVFVNRIWRWHFGRGLVASTENFGELGDRPSHPELLEWLARHFMESRWSIKELQRMILRSNVYRMASTHENPSLCQQSDPENTWLWKFSLQRLDAEQIRDAVLAVSGRLDESIGGKTVPLRNRQFVFNHTSVDHTRYDSLRRAVYLPVIRNNLYTLFEQFDFPDPTMPTGSRNATVVPPQALLMMNDELVMDSADRFASQLCTYSSLGAERIVRAYELAYGRPPTTDEVERSLRFVQQANEIASEHALADKTKPVDAEQLAWSMFCQSLLASNEFIYVR